MNKNEDSQKPREVKKTSSEIVKEAIITGVSTIPFGGGLAYLMEKYIPSRIDRVLQEYKSCLLNHAQELTDIKCNIDHLTSLIFTTSFENLKSNSKIKENTFAKIVIAFANGEVVDFSEAEVFVQILSNLTETQILILCISSDHRNAIKTYSLELLEKGKISIADFFPNIPKQVLKYGCIDLEQKGLLEQFSHNLDTNDTPVFLSYLNSSQLGEKLNSFIIVNTNLEELL